MWSPYVRHRGRQSRAAVTSHAWEDTQSTGRLVGPVTHAGGGAVEVWIGGHGGATVGATQLLSTHRAGGRWVMTSSMPSCCSRRRRVENCRPAVPSMPVTRLQFEMPSMLLGSTCAQAPYSSHESLAMVRMTVAAGISAPSSTATTGHRGDSQGSPEVQEAESRSQVHRSGGAVPDAALELTRAIGQAVWFPALGALLCCICGVSGCGICGCRLLA
jgi:hypothetical protein